jgi:hypothetical protein
MIAPNKRARLPAIPPVSSQDASMRAWLQAVTERLEVREGQRGDSEERALTQRDLSLFLAQSTGQSQAASQGWWESYFSLEELGEALRDTQMHNDLLRRIANVSGESIVSTRENRSSSHRPLV